MEIERRFLIVGDEWKKEIVQSKKIEQMYFPLKREGGITGRVRICEDRAFLTLKGSTASFSRKEFEYEIPVGDAEAIFESIRTGEKIVKTRHVVLYGGKYWEIDEFSGTSAGLLIAELELSSENEFFEKPPWLGLEITRDYRYSNSSLAENPYLFWKKDKKR